MPIRPEGPVAAKGFGPMADPLTYAQVYDWDNLYLARRKAARGKRGRPPVAAFERQEKEDMTANRKDSSNHP
jgi:hypothetical protein